MTSTMTANLQNLTHTTPDDTSADPGTIRTLAAKAPWPLAGYTKQSWANIMWLLRCALEIGGVKVNRQRRNFKLNGEWEMLIAPPSRRVRDEVQRLVGGCSICVILRRTSCRLRAHLHVSRRANVRSYGSHQHRKPTANGPSLH